MCNLWSAADRPRRFPDAHELTAVCELRRRGHTIVNFPVGDIEKTVDRLRDAGVTFEQYPSGPVKTNEKGIAHPGPWQAWFRDHGRIVAYATITV